MEGICGWRLAITLLLTHYISAQYILQPPENRVYRNGVNSVGYVTCVVDTAAIREGVYIHVTSHGSYQGLIYTSPNGWVGNSNIKFGLADSAATTGNYTLMIKSLTRNDTGTYMCQVGSESKTAKITVGDPPQVPTIEPLTNEFTENATGAFTCRSKGNLPAANFTWMKGNVEHFAETTFNGDISTSSLPLKLTHFDDETTVKCTATNELGQNSAQKFIRVKYVPRLEILPRDLIVMRGARFDLNCDIKANPTPSSVTWFKDGNVVGSARQLPENNGITNDAVYKCQALNAIGQNSITSRVIVHYAPIVMIENGPEESPVEGSDLTLVCNVTAKPEAHSVKWLYGGKVIGDGPTLTLSSITKGQAGEYTCEAINTVDPTDGAPSMKTTSSTIMVNVNYKPSKPTVTLSPATSNGVYAESTQVTLTCKVPQGGEGRPEGIVTWFKEGNPSSIDLGSGEPDGTYKIFGTKIEDTARYWCVISNNHGEGLSDRNQLTIQAAPVLLQPTNQDGKEMNGTLDSEVQMSCLFKGNPTPNIIWYKDDTRIRDGMGIQFENVISENPSFNVTSTLTISRDEINERHNGTYRCMAENAAGMSSDSYTYYLKLWFAPQLAGEDQAAGDYGKSLDIHCDIVSNPPVQQSFEFLRNGQILQSGSQYSLSVVTSNVDGIGFKQRQTLTIKTLERSDVGEYVCRARNTRGINSFTITVSESSKPEKPSDLVADVMSWDQISLSWTPGFSGGFEQRFIINVVDNSGSINDVTTNESNFNLTGLQPGHTYKIKVAAKNVKGQSMFSDMTSVTTHDLRLPEPTVSYDDDSNTLKVLVDTNRTDLCVIIEGGNGEEYKQVVEGCVVVDGEKSFSDLAKHDMYRVRACLTTRNDICSSSEEVEGEEGLPTWAIIIIIIIVVLVLIALGIMAGICWCKHRKTGGEKDPKSGHINPILSGKSAGSVDHMHLSPSIGYNHNSELDQEVDQIDSTHYGNYEGSYRPERAPAPTNDNLEYVYASVQKKSAEQNKLNDENYFDNYEMREPVNSQHSNSDNTDDFDDGPPPSPYRPNDLSFISDGHNIPVRRYPSFSESGYSTPDSKQTKKVVYEVIV